MAKDVKFNIKLAIDGKEQIVTASTNVKRFAEELEIARSKSTRVRDELIKITQVGASFQNVISGMQQLTGVMQSYTEANAVQVEAETKLAEVMRQRMDATDSEVESIKKLAGAQQELGVIGDEVQLAGVQQLSTFINQKSSIEALLPAMNNLLAQQKGLSATGQDAVNIGNLMGKAMQGQTAALRRVGITFNAAQEQVLKYGTESQRAAMLAEVITDNVGNMNAELAKTDAGKAKQLSNAIGDMKEQVGALFESIEPAIVAAGELGMAFMAVGTTISGIKGIAVGFINLASSIKMSTIAAAANNAITIISSGVHKLWASTAIACRRAAILWAEGSRLAAIQTVALSTAVKGLLISTGVGIAIVGLTYIISKLVESTDDAADSIKRANEEANKMESTSERVKKVEDAAAEAYTNTASALEINKSKLRSLIDEKNSGKDVSTEEKKIVEQLNDTYGDTMGYFSDVYQWYDALIKNSKAYCDQMVVEAKTRELANQIAKAETQRDKILYANGVGGKKKLYIKTRQRERYVSGSVEAGDGKIIPVYSYRDKEGTSDFDKAQNKVNALTTFINVAKEKITTELKRVTGLQMPVRGSRNRPRVNSANTPRVTRTPKKVAPKKIVGGNTDNQLKLIKEVKTYKDLENNVSYYQQQLEKCNITDKERIILLSKGKKAAEDAIQAFKDVADSVGIPAELSTLDDFDKKLRDLQNRRQKANSQTLSAIDEEIEKTEAAKRALENKGVAAMRVNEITTQEQLNKKLAYYNELLERGDAAQRKFAQNGINELEKLRKKWNDELAELNLPTSFNTVADIDTAVSFYTDRQQREDADHIQQTQLLINELTKKKRVMQLGIELPNMQKEVSDINSLTDKERKIKIRSIGFDELNNKIRDLSKLLNDIDHPVTKNQRKDIEELIGVYEQWKTQSISATDSVLRGWGDMKDIGGSIEGITRAIEGNGSAWEKLTSVVDGFIQLYRGISDIIAIIQLITEASKAQAVAEQSKAIAVGVSVGAEQLASVSNAETSVTAVAATKANKELTASYMEVASARFFAAHADIPFFGFAIGAGFASAATAMVKSIGVTPFAKGGIVSGPTLAMVGEYPGASKNPEVIAPLDKLQSMISPPAEGLFGNVRFEIDGRKLYGVLENVARISSKSGRRYNIG